MAGQDAIKLFAVVRSLWIQEQAEAKAMSRKSDLKAARSKLDSAQQRLQKQAAEAELADHIASLRLSAMQQELKR